MQLLARISNIKLEIVLHISFLEWNYKLEIIPIHEEGI